MKKLTYCLLALLAFSFVAHAQKTVSALEAYSKWKTSASEHLGNADNVHYSLATVTQRVDDKTARIDVVAVGQMPSLNLEIRSLIIQKRTNSSEVSPQVMGEPLKVRQELKLDKSKPNPISDLTIVIPTNSEANAIEVEWKFDADGEERSYKMILPLGTLPSANTLGVIPKAMNTNLIPLCPRGCYEVSGSTQNCGFFYKCCGTLSGNSISFVTCTITCGQACGEVD